MNQGLPKINTKTRIMREVTPKWDEAMRKADRMQFGEIIIKIQNNKIMRVIYSENTNGDDVEDYTVQSL